MKFIIIGLGNFGSTLAGRLTSLGHEVFGVDSRPEVIETHKQRITHTLAIDTSKPNAMANLPVADADMCVVAIGEDIGASILTTALLKQNNARRILSRAINPVHHTVLESIGVEQLFNPEHIAAEIFAKQLDMVGVVESFDLSPECSILEITTPARYVGFTVAECRFWEKYTLKFIGIKRYTQAKNFFGINVRNTHVDINVPPHYTLTAADVLIMIGSVHDFQKMLGRNLR